MIDEEIRKICLQNGYSELQINKRIQNTENIANLCDTKIEM